MSGLGGTELVHGLRAAANNDTAPLQQLALDVLDQTGGSHFDG
ncbi:hypothetical protein [Mycolicibacterium wolinskyi]|nr:hypothetical protein [Mycolicibacterium wolinskyi]